MEEVRPDELSILRFFLPSLPIMAPRVICLLDPFPVPEVNSTSRPSCSVSSLLSVLLLAAHSFDRGMNSGME